MAVHILLAAVILAVVMQSSVSDTHSDCGVAQTAFGMCVTYVDGDDPQLSPKCCSAVRTVKALTPREEDRRAICACLLQLLWKVGKPIDAEKAAGISTSCRVDTNVIPTSLSIDCSKIR